jgi:hypothetical protein
MTGGTKEKAPARRRGKPIEVWVTDKEKPRSQSGPMRLVCPDLATSCPWVEHIDQVGC